MEEKERRRERRKVDKMRWDVIGDEKRKGEKDDRDGVKVRVSGGENVGKENGDRRRE